MSAKAFFDSKQLDLDIVLYRRAETVLAPRFVELYKKNVVNITPWRTYALRRSIITQALGNKAEIGWRSPYAGAHEKGSHRGSRQYTDYNDLTTGAGFATKAFIATTAQMPALYRELGLTK